MNVLVQQTDVVVIGAGAVGLATAYNLLNVGVRRVMVLEKEAGVARHQTGRNSGVLHSGLYYEPGSMRAETCRLGKLAMEAFCQVEGVAIERCGKVVVATDESELVLLRRIQERADANGVAVERVGPDRLRELEPSAAGLAALWVPGTGIVDFVGVCNALVRNIEGRGAVLRLSTRFARAREARGKMLVETSSGPLEARVVVACAGLQADRVARALGLAPDVCIIPFRGEYHLLGERGRQLVNNLIYPVPDPRFPFLGVHFTRRFDGTIDCGPNAMLALGREDYDRREFDLGDLADLLGCPGLLRLAWRHRGYGLRELHRSRSKVALASALQKLIPMLEPSDLEPGPSGIRAQAVTREGKFYSDFLIEQKRRVVCVLNSPSPAATACIEIGRIVAAKVCAQLDF